MEHDEITVRPDAFPKILYSLARPEGERHDVVPARAV